MSGEDQERFEDYLELERYIEELQAGRVAHPPKDLTPSQASIYRMAALFRSASPEAAMPRPEFVEDLRARLLALDEEDPEITLKRPAIPNLAQQEVIPVPAQDTEEPQMPVEEPVPVQTGQQEQEVQPLPLPQRGVPKKVRFVSRRALLTGGAVAAASMAAGTAIGAAVKPAASSTPSAGIV
ncbi:MAG: hypothetical protein JOZ18_23775, partial [Chloroflexi bacterium]|nr:hypothetical protein [Chloroflexota bacterium]